MKSIRFFILIIFCTRYVLCRVVNEIGGDNRVNNATLLDGLPDGIDILESQVGGHTFKKDERGVFKDQGGFVLKAAVKTVCGVREIEFYESLMSNASDPSDPSIDALRKFVPEYRGIVKMPFRGEVIDFMKLRDITHGMDEPCVLDVKIGKQTWDPLATPDKIEKEKKSHKVCKEKLGFCIPGFQVYDIKTGDVKRFGRNYGKQLNESTVKDALNIFLNGDAQLSSVLVKKFLSALQPILEWAQTQTSWRFYASSLLLTYDAKRLKSHMQCLHNNNSTSNSMDQCNADAGDWVFVKMIDFAHAFRAEDESLDTNYLFGIENLVKMFTKFLNECNH